MTLPIAAEANQQYNIEQGRLADRRVRAPRDGLDPGEIHLEGGLSPPDPISSTIERVRELREQARQHRFDRAEAKALKAAQSGSPTDRRAAVKAMADALCYVPAERQKRRRRYRATRGGSGILTGAIKAPVSYVYVIGAFQQSVKVGLSECPEKRLADLQTSNPAKLRLHFKAEVPPDRVRFVEMQAHKALAGKRLAGEWFDCSPDEAEQTVKAIIAAL